MCGLPESRSYYRDTGSKSDLFYNAQLLLFVSVLFGGLVVF
ncbi:hypothetical protein HMPREF0208_02565 [Citrobacter koseri]|nr:hypothetical protein HMPREF0208_02565 [Citrobacter koseri]